MAIGKSSYVKRQMSELVFEGRYVYKRHLDNLLDEREIESLISMDKIFNTRPVILSIEPDDRTPFVKHGVLNRPVVKMRRLNDNLCLDSLLKNGEDGTKLVSRLGHSLYTAHSKTLVHCNSEVLVERFNHDLRMLEVRISRDGENIDEVKYLLQTLSGMVSKNTRLLKRRSYEGYIRDVHGDLDLTHIYKEKTYFAYIDFSDFQKYRIDDVSRDLSGLVLSLYEIDKRRLVEPLIQSYQLIYDKNLRTMISMQVFKKALLKYYIYSGGFDIKHRDSLLLKRSVKTIGKLAQAHRDKEL